MFSDEDILMRAMVEGFVFAGEVVPCYSVADFEFCIVKADADDWATVFVAGGVVV